MTPTARGGALVGAATLGFASLGTLSNVAYASGVSAPAFVALRAGLGALLLAGLAAGRPQLRVPLSGLPRREQAMLLLAIILNGAFNLALFAAFEAMAVAAVLAIYFTHPLIVGLASAALGRERLTAARSLGIGIAMLGVVVVLGERIGAAAPVPAGLVLAGLAAVLQAAYLVVSRSGFPSVPAEQAITVVLLGGALMASGAMVVTEPAPSRFGTWLVEPLPWLAIGASAMLGTAAAKVWLLRGLRLIGATRAAVIMLGEPVGGALLAALVLGQSLTAPVAAGGLLVLLGALVVQRPAPGRDSSTE